MTNPGLITEAQFQAQVIQLAKLYQWRVMHSRPARALVRGVETWRTPLQGHAGFPDLVLAKNGRIIFAELKIASGKLSEEQMNWQCALGVSDSRVLVTVWRPAEWQQICQILQG